MEKEQLLNEMLDIAIRFMNEQEACVYCVHCDRREDCAHNDDYCYNGIYDGLLKRAQKASCSSH